MTIALARHRLRVIEAMMALIAARLMLRILPFSATMRLAGRAEACSGDSVVPSRTSDPVTAGVGVAVKRATARLPWRFTCLDRSLAGHFMLMRRGVPSTIVVGVAKEMEQISGHAWLVAAGGVVCGGREAQNFKTIAAFQESTSREI